MQNAIVKNPVTEYLRQPDNFQDFVNLLGKDAAPYVQSVIIAASSTEDLMQCTPQSIHRAALRAASLGLSCDPAVKQAWLIPRNRNIAPKGQPPKWIKEAQFQPHYFGVYFLAMRTNKYWIINVAPIYEGQQVFENPLTGLHAVQEENGFMGQPQSYNAAYSRNVTVRRDQGKKVIGWLGYYKTTKGFEKSVYMSCVEIEEHAMNYVKDYLDDDGKIKNPNWKDPKKRPTMEMKTVLRALLNWADKSGIEHSPQLREALRADEPIDVEAEDIPVTQDLSAQAEPEDITGDLDKDFPPETDLHPMTYDEAKQVVVKVKGGKEKFMGELTKEQLDYVIEKSILNEKVEAARIVLAHDFQMEAVSAEPESPKLL